MSHRLCYPSEPLHNCLLPIASSLVRPSASVFASPSPPSSLSLIRKQLFQLIDSLSESSLLLRICVTFLSSLFHCVNQPHLTSPIRDFHPVISLPPCPIRLSTPSLILVQYIPWSCPFPSFFTDIQRSTISLPFFFIISFLPSSLAKPLS